MTDLPDRSEVRPVTGVADEAGIAHPVETREELDDEETTTEEPAKDR